MTRFSLTKRLAILLGLSIFPATMAHAQCDPEWSDRFALPGINSQVYAAVRFNDGSGEKIYVAGNLRDVGSVGETGLLGNSYGVVRWNGTSWEAVGTGFASSPGCSSFEGGQTVYALAVYDPDGPDGPLPASLYAGGDFFFSNCVLTRCVARWDVPTSSWKPLKGGVFISPSAYPDLTAANTAKVISMAVYDPDGAGPQHPQLYVAGSFNRTSNNASGGTTGFKTYGIARWDGNTETWSNVGGEGVPGLSGPINGQLLVYDDDGAGPIQPALYYGGRFNAVGGEPFVSLAVASQGFARWDGTTWTDVPGIAISNAYVHSIAAYDNGTTRSLWVSGNIDGTGVPYAVAKRNDGSTAWTNVPIPGGPIHLAQYGNDMMAVTEWAGQPPNGFPVVYGQYESTLAKWSPASPAFASVGKLFRTSTHPINGGGRVNFLLPCDFDLAGPGGNKLFIGGDFFQADAQAVFNIALWNGAGFERIVDNGSEGLGGYGGAGVALDPDGSGPMPESLYLGFVRFDGTSYHPITFPDVYPGITSMSAGGFVVHNDGTGPAVYCTGEVSGDVGIYRLTGDTANRIAYVDGVARRLVSYDDGSGPALWAFGDFSVIGGVPANNIARLTSAGAWVAADNGFPPGTDTRFQIAEVYNPGSGAKLYTATMAFWNGTAWDNSAAPVITGVWFNDDVPTDMAVYNGEIYIGGRFMSVAGVPGTNGIAKWNGTIWSSVGGGISGAVVDMQVHDDGTGPKLYVTGPTSAGGGSIPTQQKLAIWDGSAWSTLAYGDTGCSYDSSCGCFSTNSCFGADTLESFNGALYVGGSFTVWDGKAAAGITAYERPCTPCPADFNHVNGVTVQDIFDFLAAWFAGNTTADFNQVNGVTVQDIFDFLAAWFAGC